MKSFAYGHTDEDPGENCSLGLAQWLCYGQLTALVSPPGTSEQSPRTPSGPPGSVNLPPLGVPSACQSSFKMHRVLSHAKLLLWCLTTSHQVSRRFACCSPSHTAQTLFLEVSFHFPLTSAHSLCIVPVRRSRQRLRLDRGTFM